MSIRTYIFSLLTSLVLIISVIYSYQSGRLFIGALDMAVEGLMLDIGAQYPKNGKDEQQVLQFHVTTDWNKVPQPVRDRFKTIPTQKNVHHSIFVDWIYIAPPEKAYSLMVVERDNKQIYISRFNERLRQHLNAKYGFAIDPMVWVLIVGCAGITLFVMTLLTIFKKVALPMESLQQWAKTLKINDLSAPLPDFKFKELNSLASLIHQNLVSVAQSIKREQSFLNYASHELRTPIAVLRSNSALLEKVNPTPSDKERIIRDRIERASLTMKSMTETLLWLSREGETKMSVESVCLGELVEHVTHELNYLLAGKSVEVNLKVDQQLIELAKTPGVIVLNNLIRNAFQHTQSGHVEIVQQGHQVVITNIESSTNDHNQTNDELGFGLGMLLVEKLTKQFNWRYTTEQLSNGYQVTVYLSD